MDRRLRPPRSTTTQPAPVPAQADDQWLPDPAKDRSTDEQAGKQPGGAPFLGHSFAAVPIFPEGRAANPPQRSAPTPAVDAASAEDSAVDDGGSQAEAGSAAADQAGAVDAPTTDTARRIRAASGGGSALEPAIGTTLAPRFGHDLSRVRIHADSEADHLARAVEARAFTTGNDIFFRAGAYNPGSAAGMHTLAHEIAHVEQQAAGPVAGTPTATGLSISDPSDPFEQAAQRTADSVMSGGMATAAVPTGVATATAVQRQLAIQRDPRPVARRPPPPMHRQRRPVHRRRPRRQPRRRQPRPMARRRPVHLRAMRPRSSRPICAWTCEPISRSRGRRSRAMPHTSSGTRCAPCANHSNGIRRPMLRP